MLFADYMQLKNKEEKLKITIGFGKKIDWS